MSFDESEPHYQPPREPLEEWQEVGRKAVPRPGVVNWFVVFCSLMTFLSALLILMGGFMAFAMPNMPNAGEADRAMMPIVGGAYAVGGLFVSVLYLIGIFAPKRPWGWVYGIVLICLSMTSCCTLPAAIPLLIFWIRPETKWYYGMT